jgi:glutamate transport system permease protein
MDVFVDNWDAIRESCLRTVEMVIAAGAIALVLGAILAAMRVSPITLARALGTLYVYTIRNTPLLVIMIIAAFGIPDLDVRPTLSFGDSELVQFNVFFIFATAALGCYTAAFVCEAVRSGINSIPLGQAEAARSVGMTFTQTLRFIILPQAFRAVIPPIASALIAMAKNSSVAVGVGVTEATFQLRKLTNDNPGSLWELFIGFALFYMAIVAVIAGISAFLERKLRVAK